jgi:hypothetical protein
LLYIYSSYPLWEPLNNWHDWNILRTKTAFFIHSQRISNPPMVIIPAPKIFNLPFIILLVIMATNCSCWYHTTLFLDHKDWLPRAFE